MPSNSFERLTYAPFGVPTGYGHIDFLMQYVTGSLHHSSVLLNPFVLSALFFYPLKTLENLPVFWCIQGVEKGCIGNKWVNRSKNSRVTIFHTFIPSVILKHVIEAPTGKCRFIYLKCLKRKTKNMFNYSWPLSPTVF